MTAKLAIVTAIDIGFKRLLLPQVKAALNAGFEVHGVCTKGANFEFLSQLGIKMHPITIKRSMSPLSDLVSIWRMYRFFKREKITIVHTHFPKAGLLGQFAAKLAAVPIIIHTLHGFYLHENMKPWVKRFHIALEWISARCSTSILSQNPEDIETAVKTGICKRDHIRLLGNGVDLSRFDSFRFDAEFKKKKRAEIGVPQNATVISIIGRLVQEKGYLDLFAAMRDVMAEYDHVWLLIIGPEEPEKADAIRIDALEEYGIEKRTRWLGNRDDVPELLACSDIFALPSWREGFPRSAIEAAAMALPVVATNIRGCRQVVEHGAIGLLVPLRNSRALASALKRLIDDGELQHKMGQAGYKKARQEFDETKVVATVLAEYKRSLSKLHAKAGWDVKLPGF